MTGRLEELRSWPLDRLRHLFWATAGELVAPLIEMAAEYTTPSIERSVLLRMGFDSLEAKEIVDLAVAEGWLGEGVGGRVHRHAATHGVSRRAAFAALTGSAKSGEERNPQVLGPPVPLSMAPDQPLPVDELLTGLDRYRPRRRGWIWRDGKGPESRDFSYRQTSSDLLRRVPLQAAEYFGGADPQPDCVITSEIASGRFEDDIRRMRMAAWHGADHIMVIRTLGQSHFDGLIEGTPEGVGGVPITRKQLRATRRALDLIEDEVGRPINLHSYVSGLAGPEMAVVFAEEGVGGAHQDCQYNILYRNINPLRSVVDAFEAKRVLAEAGLLQLDGAHNANSTSLRAWKVRPELLVQHALNCAMSDAAGFDRGLVALSTVPPTAPPAPKLTLDLPYAVAVRYLFEGYRFRAQQNTRYSTTSPSEATVLHVLDTMVSRLTHADIQSTIAPDEARWVPWHVSSVQAVAATKQTLVGLDGLTDLVRLDSERITPLVIDLVARAISMIEDMLAAGGYFDALGAGFFVDNGLYPERVGDGIRRLRDGGVGAGTVVPRSPDYLAPVCGHFGRNEGSCAGCTLCGGALVRYIDELDDDDNVATRRAAVLTSGRKGVLPEAEHRGDGWVTVSMFVPLPEAQAGQAAIRFAEGMGLKDVRVVDKVVLHPAEGVQVELAGRMLKPLDPSTLSAEPGGAARTAPPEEIRAELAPYGLRVVGATLGNDEHTVGLQEITNIKHQGLEWFGVTCVNLGASVPVDRLLDEAVEQGAVAVLASLIVSHRQVHEVMMRNIHDTAVERGVRGRLLLIAGGPQVTDQMARECGLDAGFGRGTTGWDVARFLAHALRGDRHLIEGVRHRRGDQRHA